MDLVQFLQDLGPNLASAYATLVALGPLIFAVAVLCGLGFALTRTKINVDTHNQIGKGKWPRPRM